MALLWNLLFDFQTSAPSSEVFFLIYLFIFCFKGSLWFISPTVKHRPKTCNFHYSTYPPGLHVLNFMGPGSITHSVLFICFIIYWFCFYLVILRVYRKVWCDWFLFLFLFVYAGTGKFFVSLKGMTTKHCMPVLWSFTVWIINIVWSRSGHWKEGKRWENKKEKRKEQRLAARQDCNVNEQLTSDMKSSAQVLEKTFSL